MSKDAAHVDFCKFWILGDQRCGPEQNISALPLNLKACVSLGNIFGRFACCVYVLNIPLSRDRGIQPWCSDHASLSQYGSPE